MKILLVNPWSVTDAIHKSVPLSPVVPYGLLYLAAVLEKSGHEVRILDRNADERSPEQTIREFQPEVVGLSAMTGPSLIDAVALSELAKRVDRKIKVVWGGVHPTLCPEQTLAESGVDLIVGKEGEITVVELLGALERNSDLARVKGICFKRDGRIIRTEERPVMKDINELPDPAWHLLKMEKYVLRRNYDQRNCFTLNTSRGCPYRCAFCYNQKFDNNWRGLTAARVLEQLLHLKEKYGINYVNFLEDNFTVDRDRVKEICRLIIDRGMDLQWECESRIGALDRETLKLMKRAGCRLIGFGVESGSPRILKMIKKGITVEQIKQTLEDCRNTGIWTDVYFMAGFPGETMEDLGMTLRLMRKLPYKRCDFMIFRPYPGSELYRQCLAEGLFRPPENLQGWSDISDVHSARFSVGSLNEFILEGILRRNQRMNKLKNIGFILSVMPLRKVFDPRTWYKGAKYLKYAYSKN